MSKTVEDVRSNVEKFRWENKKKSYEGDIQDLKSLYWHVVVHDIIGDNHLDSEPIDYKPLIQRISRSYLGVFFWYHKLLHDLKKQFEDLHVYRLKEEEELWESWKKETTITQSEAIAEIVDKVKLATNNEEFMVKNRQIGKLPFNWRKYNSYYQSKTETVSKSLTLHLRDGSYYYKDMKSPEIFFSYRLKKKLVEILHREAFKLIKTIVLYQIFFELEKRKSEVEKNDKILREVPPTIEVYKNMPINKAIENLFDNNPAFKELKLSQIKHHIITKYRNSKGESFKDDSVDKALRRAGFKN